MSPRALDPRTPLPKLDLRCYDLQMRSLAIASFAVLTLGALPSCAPTTPEAPLPPAGIAGAPAAPGLAGIAPSAALTTLPGAGRDIAPPTGGKPSSGQLPPGHPPIDTAPVDPSASAQAPVGGPPESDEAVQFTGAVLETIDVPEYTYMRVKSAGGEDWVAISKTAVAVGDTVTVSSQLVMENFASKSLNRTFPKLLMGMLVGAPKKP